MALTINTNLSSLIVQQNLEAATDSLTRSIERMTTGYRINNAKDDAAGYSIAMDWRVQLSSLDVAAQNNSTGIDLLTTAEENYALIVSHLQRIRDLTEQAANGTYGSASLSAINAEIVARLEEIDRVAANAEYNGIALMDGTTLADVSLQVGIYENANSRIVLSAELFGAANTQGLFTADIQDVADACTTATTAPSQLTAIDEAISKISARVTDIGAYQNRLESASTAIDVQIENLTSSLSTIRDTDVAQESSNYIQAQILQQAAATLLATANQTPSIALNLV